MIDVPSAFTNCVAVPPVCCWIAFCITGPFAADATWLTTCDTIGAVGDASKRKLTTNPPTRRCGEAPPLLLLLSLALRRDGAALRVTSVTWVGLMLLACATASEKPRMNMSVAAPAAGMALVNTIDNGGDGRDANIGLHIGCSATPESVLHTRFTKYRPSAPATYDRRDRTAAAPPAIENRPDSGDAVPWNVVICVPVVAVLVTGGAAVAPGGRVTAGGGGGGGTCVMLT